MKEGLVHLATADVLAPNGHPGTDIDAADVRIWAARITERWRASVQAIIDVGQLLIEAKARMPHGTFGDMIATQLPFSDSTARRLMAIAEDKRLTNRAHVHVLPASWGTLYELTKLSDDEFNNAVEQKVIRPDMLRGEAELIRPLARGIPEPAESGDPDQNAAGGVMIPSMAMGQSGEQDAGELRAVSASASSSPALLAPADPATDKGASDDDRSHAPPASPSMPSGGLAIAHRRVEPTDGLDFFPTPPWATRALFEHVLVHLERRGHCKFQNAWEPACGEGHMAEVLKEYFRGVLATDIHDYGYGDEHHDFFAKGAHPADWIITNPPFNNSVDFVLKALSVAGTGVGMFVRAAWLEGVDRYERIFSTKPPTLVSFFTERVPLHKGRWEPDGATFTAYIWLVWLKGAAPQAPFWIPPGCRERLTKPDDVKRFGKSVVEAA